MKPQPRHIKSSDYDDLIEHALAMGDEEWFTDLIFRKKKLEVAEEEVQDCMLNSLGLQLMLRMIERVPHADVPTSTCGFQ
jgi:hypothetical protein